MKKNRHVICRIEKDSIAEELGLEPGDTLMTINGHQIEDIFDYQYLTEDEYIELLIEKPDGEEWLLEIEKDEDEDLGIGFENGLMDEYRSCRNKCMFCFIDQMPPGMRETLYFKDDDSRLSFLQGNYVTLTNMSDHDVERIIRYRLSPINVSVHTTNPQLRCRMLNNRFAGNALEKIKQFKAADIRMNGQIVLCPGINDKAELDRTIRDLTAYLPQMQSVSVVPVGLTRFREGLYPLRGFTKAEAEETLELIEDWRTRIYDRHGFHFIHASDEFYLLAEQELPGEEAYDGYPQLENGVGMLRLLIEEVEQALAEAGTSERKERITLATGRLAAPTLKQLAARIRQHFPGIETQVCPIRNDYFGESITVSGLITGQDLIAQLSGRELGSRVLIPANMLRSGETVFLDDVTVSELENALQVPVNIVKSSGYELVRAITGGEAGSVSDEIYRPYELKENEYE